MHACAHRRRRAVHDTIRLYYYIINTHTLNTIYTNTHIHTYINIYLYIMVFAGVCALVIMFGFYIAPHE